MYDAKIEDKYSRGKKDQSNNVCTWDSNCDSIISQCLSPKETKIKEKKKKTEAIEKCNKMKWPKDHVTTHLAPTVGNNYKAVVILPHAN